MKLSYIESLTPGQFSKLPQERQERIMRFVASQANSRATNLENSGMSEVSYAYGKLMEGGGRIRTTGTPQQLKTDFIRGKRFLGSVTSKVTGTRQTVAAPFKPQSKAAEKRIAEKLAKGIKGLGLGSSSEPINHNKSIWSAIDKARELGAEKFLGSERLISIVYDRYYDQINDITNVDDFIDELALFAADMTKEGF